MRKVGRMLNGPDALIGALRDVVGPEGTLLAYLDWDDAYGDLTDAEGRVLPEWRSHVPPFDPVTSRASRNHGVLAEFIRTTPGTRRSGNPGASMAALGARAEWFTEPHPMDYGYGAGTPFARLVEAGGKVLLAGAPFDSLTLLHHAEHIAPIPGKRIVRYEAPLATADGVIWRTIEEFDTSLPVVDGLAEDYFDTVVRDFLATGQGAQGLVGDGPSVLVDAAAITAFAVDWLVRRIG